MRTKISVSLLLLVTVIMAVYFWQGRPSDMAMAGSVMTQEPSEPIPQYWVAPMDANYRRDEPGLSPMGMALIPVYQSGDTIRVSASIQQNLGVRTAAVVLQDFAAKIHGVGYTQWDESSIQILHTRAQGWLEQFNLASVGDPISQGDVIYELFAPALLSAQREYLSAIQSNNNLAAMAGQRLLALGFTQEQIDQIEQSGEVSKRLVVRASRDAIITQLGVRQGSYVQPHTTLATLASLDKVWIDVEVFETLAALIEPNLPVQVTFSAFPGEVWNTQIDSIYPTLDPITRSLRLRLVIDNETHKLRPNMFAKVVIDGIAKLNVLTVPREAVIRAGQGERVIVSLGNGQFRPQIVRVGRASGERVEILSGLSQTDVVVTSGQFLLDSQANGEQAFARLNAATAVNSGAAAAVETMNMNMNMDTATPGAMNMLAADSASLDVAELDAANLDALNLDQEELNTATLYSTTGNITRITQRDMTLAHQAVSELAWPMMTMTFKLAPGLDISLFEVGDTVLFDFSRLPDGSYELRDIRNQDGRND